MNAFEALMFIGVVATLTLIYGKGINLLIQLYQKIGLVDPKYLFAFDEYKHNYERTSVLWAIILTALILLGWYLIDNAREKRKLNGK